jgi:cullin-associated NEDD8-dissociated protein 1
VLLLHHAKTLTDDDVAAVVSELAALVTDADLHVAHLALVLGRTVVAQRSKQMAGPLREVLLPKVLLLLQSSLLQGVALRSLLAFFAELVAHDLSGLTLETITAELLALPA